MVGELCNCQPWAVLVFGVRIEVGVALISGIGCDDDFFG